MQTVTVSSKGQIVIPKNVRERLKIKEGTRLTINVEHESIVMRRDHSGWRRLRGLAAGQDLIAAHLAEKNAELEHE